MNSQRSHIDPADLAFIAAAARALEHPGRMVGILNTLGRPAESLLKRLPSWAAKSVDRAVRSALTEAVEWAVRTIDPKHPGDHDSEEISDFLLTARGALHTAAAAALGGVSGAFGITALPIELPITTIVILRSIAATARDLGADLGEPATRLECVSVLSLGGPSPADDAMESSYLTSRVGLALLIRDASSYLAGRTAQEASEALARGAAPEMLRLLSAIASRFGYTAAEIASAQMLPIAGAVGGMAINGYFANFFNRIARYHFGLRRLERIYGEEPVQNAYREQMTRLGG
jgi:hypothetical protein